MDLGNNFKWKKILGTENVKILELAISKRKHFILEIYKFKQLPGGDAYQEKQLPKVMHTQMLGCLFLLFHISNYINGWLVGGFFVVLLLLWFGFCLDSCLFSLISFLFTVHFCKHWIILLFLSKEVFKGNRALVSL